MRTARLHCILAAALFFAAGFGQRSLAQDIPVYLAVDEMPDIVKCLPAPPDTLSDAFAYDVMRYFWGKSQRLDPERAAIAVRDATWSLDTLFMEFGGALGMELSREATPEIWTLLESGVSTIEQIRVRPKAYYHRKRPYVRFNEHSLTVWEESDLASEGSYPSGHTIRAWSTALLLSEINPSAADTLFRRAVMVGESRVIVGAHWQSDVDASYLVASIGYASLQNCPAFLAQKARAREEFARLSGASKTVEVPFRQQGRRRRKAA